jgi:hypothetical protein
MNVAINRAEYDDGWKDRVAENLKEKNGVDLDNFAYPDDLESCIALANKFGAKVTLNAEKNVCRFRYTA